MAADLALGGLVDAHVHVWNPALLRYPWLDGVPVLNRAFSPAEIDRADGATSRHVFVQAGCRADQALDEVHWVLGMADAWPELAAIVADADLRAGSALPSHLDALVALNARGGVRIAGVRHLLQDEPDDLLTDQDAGAALVQGLRAVSERGLTFDVCVRHHQLHTVVELLEQVPELPVVLDHLGKPPVDAGIESSGGRTWADAITRLARLPLATVKLSGLAAEASGTAALDAHADGFLVHVLLAFGPERCMIGSDWPVSAHMGAGGTFASWRSRVRGVTAEGMASIEHGTATRFYGL